MSFKVRFRGGTKKAKQTARRLGIKIGTCRQIGGDSRPTFTAYGTPSRPGGRIVLCEVPCSAHARKVVRDEFVRENGGVVWFYDRC